MGKTITYDYEYIDGKQPEGVHMDEEAVNNMTEEALHQAALSDPDAQPLTEEQMKHFKRVNPNLPKKEA